MEADSLILHLIVSRFHTLNHGIGTFIVEEITWTIHEWHEPKGVPNLIHLHSNKDTQVSNLMKPSKIQISILSSPILSHLTMGIPSKTICRKEWWQHKTCETLSTDHFTTKSEQWMLHPLVQMSVDHSVCRQASWLRAVIRQSALVTETALPLSSNTIHHTSRHLKYRTPLLFTKRATRMAHSRTESLPQRQDNMDENHILIDTGTRRRSSRR